MSLALDELTFAHPGGPAILQRASLTVTDDAFLLVRGPSGAGKSTLLRLLCRLEQPQAGTIRYRERDVATIPPAEYRARVAYLQQTPTVVEGSVRANLLLPFSFKVHAGRRPPDDAALTEQLDALRLGGIDLAQDARTLSVGEAQRVCLARSLLLEPEVLLLDEPTSALDTESTAAVLQRLRGARHAGVTILMSWHAEAAVDGVTGTVRIEAGKLSVA